MKDILKNIGKGISIGFGFILIVGTSYLAIQARQATNPGISDTTPNSLYVNNNETLTAAKRNSLVTKVSGGGNGSRQDVSLSDTANFDTGCERRAATDGIPRQTLYFTNIYANNIYWRGSSSEWRAIANTAKGTAYYLTNTKTIIFLQKKCQ